MVSGSRHLVAGLLVLATLSRIGSAQDAAPYSTLTLRVGGIATRTASPLHTYYPGGHGLALEMETPIELGTLGLVFDAITFHGENAAQVTTSTNTIALDWRGKVAVGSRVTLRGGARIGDFHMVFQDPAFNNPGATNDHGTESFLIGPTGAVDLRLFNRFTATVAGSWVYLPTARPTKMTNLSVLGGFPFAMPHWLQEFLR